LDKLAQDFPLTPHYTLAKSVEHLTLQKKSNLILNVDGAIAALLLDIMIDCHMSSSEISHAISHGLFNGFFVLARSIGLIGHYLDQKRLGE
jgi:citrate synthase